MSKSNDIGVCKICGKSAKLTNEHVPPKAAFNNKKVEMLKGDSLIDIITGKRLPWESDGLFKHISQNGQKEKTLCSSCNSFTGKYYASWYVDFCNAINNFIVSSEISSNQKIKLALSNIKPLNILKQIISMFASNSSITNYDSDIRKFIIDKENNCFPVHKYRVYFNIFREGIPKNTGVASVFTTKGTYQIMQIAAYPLEVTLLLNYQDNKDHDLAILGTDITEWCNYSLGETTEVVIDANIVSSFSPMPLEYRSYHEMLILNKKTNR